MGLIFNPWRTIVMTNIHATIYVKPQGKLIKKQSGNKRMDMTDFVTFLADTNARPVPD